jgi:hypothetical protein
VVAGSKLNKVLIDSGSGLNVLFTKTLKKMKLDITQMLTKSTSPFYGIVPGNVAIPLGLVVLPVTFGESRNNYRTECRMDLPGPTTSVGTRTDYSVGPWDYPACATRHLKAWSTRTTQE